MSDNYDPEYLSELDRETEFMNSSGSKKFATRFQLKEVGESALIRLIPYRFDEKGRWFARISRHWINNRPYICTNQTDVTHGGDPDGRCEICDMVNDFNKSRDKKISDTAYRMMAVAQWATQILVFETFDSRGRQTKNPDPYKAQEFWLYKEPFADILQMFKNYLRKKPEQPLSILDPEFGCDILVTKAKRGYRFEREDPAPISKTPKETLERVLKGINFEIEKPLEGEDLDNLLLKIKDSCEGRVSRRDDDRRGSSRDRDLDLDEDDRGSSRRGDDRRDDRGRSSVRDDDRRAPAADDRRSSSRRDDPVDDRRSSRETPPARNDERRAPATDDRRAPRDDDRRSSRDERAPARDDDRSSRSSREEPVDDRRGSREEPSRSSRREEPVSRSRRDDVDGRVGSRGSDIKDLDTESEEGDGSEGEHEQDQDRDTPPPPLSRSSRGAPPPPPAAGRGAGTPPPARGAQEPKDDDVDLPDGDKDRAPAEEPKPGEVVDSKESAATPEKRPFQSTLTKSLASRIQNHQQRSTT